MLTLALVQIYSAREQNALRHISSVLFFLSCATVFSPNTARCTPALRLTLLREIPRMTADGLKLQACRQKKETNLDSVLQVSQERRRSTRTGLEPVQRSGSKSRFEMQPGRNRKWVALAWKGKSGITQQVATGKGSNLKEITRADIPNQLQPSWRRRDKKGSLTCANTVHFSPHRWRFLSHKHENTLSSNAPTDWLSRCEKKQKKQVIVIYNSKSGKRTLCADV